jgi:hypothetical protein
MCEGKSKFFALEPGYRTNETHLPPQTKKANTPLNNTKDVTLYFYA